MTEAPKRGRGRPPGSKNKIKREKPKSKRVERRKAGAKMSPRPAAPPPVIDVQAEIVLPGEEFGARRPAQAEFPDLTEGSTVPEQMTFVWPRPRGRPPGTGILKPDEITLDRIWRVGWEQGNRAVLAVALGVSMKTVQRFFEDHPEARDVFEDAAAAGRGRVGIEVYRAAMAGNTVLLKHAAEHWADMTYRAKPVVAHEGEEDTGGNKTLQRIVIELVDAKNPAS